jgi:hypothetical protein
MRIVELLNNISLPITNEEADLLREFDGSTELYKADLDPRQQVIANQLVNKDVLYRIQENGRITYCKKIQETTTKSGSGSDSGKAGRFN